jgi:hypothetical protein
MEQSPYPQELLHAPVSERVRFFVDYTMAHPHLIKAFNEVMQSVYNAPGISLIFVVGATYFTTSFGAKTNRESFT